MSKRFRKIFGLSKRKEHPTAHSSGQSNPERRSIDQPTQDPRTSGQSTSNQQRNTELYGAQPIPQATSGGHLGPHSCIQPTPDPRSSDQGSQRTPDPIPSGQSTSTPRFSRQPTINPHFGDQPPDPRASGQHTPNQQRINDPYPGGQHILEPTASGQRAPISSSDGQRTPDPRSSSQATFNPRLGNQPTPDRRFSGEPTPYQQRIIDVYGGQPPLEATSGGYRGRYSGSQLTVHPYFGDQPSTNPRLGVQPNPYQERMTDPYRSQPILEAASSGQHAAVLHSIPYPWFGGQSTADQQRATNPYPGGQRILQPNSGGQFITDGIYTITNVYQKRFIYLEDANDRTPLRGHFNQENRSARWHVIQRVDGEYSIKNVDHDLYASCGSRARLDAFVEGHSEEQLWHIQERYRGQYTIAAIDSGNLWMLPDKEKDTPVTFSKVPTDPMCLWSFRSAEIVAPVNENPIARQLIPDTGLPLAPSGIKEMPDAAIVEFISVITEATDLLPPLRVACKALNIILQRVESIGRVNEDQKALIKQLKFHLATVENDIAKLEEDQKIDNTIAALNQAVRESLETYARELKETYELLSYNQPSNFSLVNKVTSIDRNKGIIADKIRKIDDAFQKYTATLYQFAANTVAQMQQELAQFGQAFQQGAHTLAEKVHPNRANAYGIQHRECLQGTREKTLQAISDWVDNESAKNWIFFFLDVAGSGKSTVAKHMAGKWKREDRMLARFFFSRDTAETMTTNSFCSTVAGAFADHDRNYKHHMDKFTARPNVELLSFEERFEGLVAGPLRGVGRRAILIIDALDECDARQRDELLETLRDQHSTIPLLRILTTGRPERDIKRWANEKFGFGYTNFIQLEENDKDVELYIKHTLQDVPDIQDRLYPVISRAEGLFIWARIACDLLLDSDDIDGLLEELGKEVSLDYLYKVALEQSLPKEGPSRRAAVLVLQMILAAREPLSIAQLEILSPKPGIVERIVTRLGSVLLYQGREDPIRLLHATFREFLVAQSKADIFFIQPELGHRTLASGCLATIGDRSKQEDAALQKLDTISRRKEVLFEQDTY